MEQIVRFDFLLFAGMLLCAWLLNWVKVPDTFVLRDQDSARRRRLIRYGAPAGILVLCVVTFFPPHHFSPTTDDGEVVLVLLTPVWALLLCVCFVALIVAIWVRTHGSPKRRK